MFRKLLPVFMIALTAASCGRKLERPPPTDIPIVEPAVPTRGHVRFKGGVRYQIDLAVALQLDLTEVCNELGLYSCAAIHNVLLGGTDPYRLGMYEPTPDLSVATPLVVERIALSACIARVDRDLGGETAVFDLAVGADGTLTDPDTDIPATVETIYKLGFARLPEPEAIDLQRALYDDILADGESDAARDWAVLACSAVFTSTEALFY